MTQAGERVGLSAEDVFLAYLESGASERETARRLGVSQSTVRHHLKRVSRPTVPRINLPGLDPEDRVSAAVGKYLRACLDRAGVSSGGNGE